MSTVSSRSSRTFSVLQKVGQSLMVPVSVLPAAGLLVAMARLLQDSNLPAVKVLGKIFFSGGIAIFEQLPAVFAIGVAIGFTGGAGVAGLAAVAGYFTLTNVLKVMTEARGLTLAINTGVFGGILVGLLTASLYQRFYQTRLPAVLGFFSGKRLVPIVTVASSIVFGILLGFIWPPIQMQINAFGVAVMGSSLGPAFYAAGKRLLIPVGLHHVYYPPFLFEFGEFVGKTGAIVRGESARYYAGDPTAGRFMASEFPIMLFGLPMAALAMTLRAFKENRKQVAGVMLSAALTSIVTGITEPIEFAFIFVAPILYVFHVLAAFASGLLTSQFDIHLGYSFSASIIDFVVGFFNQQNSLYLWFLVGPIIGAAYFFAFYFLIGKFDLKTPGRDKDEASIDGGTVSTSDRAEGVLKALGGKENIKALDACITRLRVTVKDSVKVNVDAFKKLGAAGTLNAGGGNFQIIFGTESEFLKEEIKAITEGRSTPKRAEEKVLVSRSSSSSVKPSSLNFKAPLSGEFVSIEAVPDETFSQKILGDGVAILPTEGVVYAPFTGTVEQIFRTNHAIGLTSDEGVECLIHIGIDTVKMNGEGFKAFVKSGDRVNSGDKLIEFDLERVKREAKSLITPILFTNADSLKSFQIVNSKTMKAKESFLTIRL